MNIFSNQSKNLDFGGECANGLGHYIQNWKVWLKLHLVLGRALGSNLNNEATGDLRVEISNKSAVINIDLVRLPDGQWPKVACCKTAK